MRCDTCRREVPEVSRVVVYVGYNRMAAKAMYNCPDCFANKEKSKPYYVPGTNVSPGTRWCQVHFEEAPSRESS